MTKIFIMGAAGRMCIEATRDLVNTSDFDKFLLADIDEKKLKDFLRYQYSVLFLFWYLLTPTSFCPQTGYVLYNIG